MKNQIRKYITWMVTVTFALALFSCKGTDSESGSKTITIDISGLKQKLGATVSTANSENRSNLESPEESDAQDTVKTLMIAPITYSNHGVPYSMDTFDKDTEDDFENDAANSINYLQFIQLPTSQDHVEVSVPAISDGWQLLAAATSNKVEEVGDIGDDGDGTTLVFVGFTEESFTSADDFTSARPSVTLQRHCDQDEEDQPKGCATYDGNKEAIVTSAVEIHGVRLNTTMLTPSYPFPWIVRANPNVSQSEISPDEAEIRLNNMVNEDDPTISTLTVLATHQLSFANSTNSDCLALDAGDSTSDFISNCTEDNVAQEYTRAY